MDSTDSGSASGSSSTADPATPRSSSDSQSKAVVATKRRIVPRRGHTKSRAGCSSCKRRRVKCDEGFPECGPCRRLALHCEYAHNKGALARSTTSPTSPTSPSQPLRTTPGVLEMGDLRFFHHFLLDAFPPLPIRGRQVWSHVAQMSHQVCVSHPGRLASVNGCLRCTLKYSMNFWRALC